MQKSFYEILQVDPLAELEVIKAAFKVLAQKYHPDRSQHSDSENFMKSLNQAYAVLSDPEQRKKYDQELHSSNKKYKSDTDNETRKSSKNSRSFSEEERGAESSSEYSSTKQSEKKSRDHVLAVSNVISSIIEKNTKVCNQETDDGSFSYRSDGTSVGIKFDNNNPHPRIWIYDMDGQGVSLDYLASYISRALDKI